MHEHAASTHRRVGLVRLLTIVVALALMTGCAGLIMESAEDLERAREMSDILDEAGLETSGRGYSRSEQACLTSRNVTPDDAYAAITDTSQAGRDQSRELLEAVIACAPDSLLEPAMIENFRQTMWVGLPGEISTAEAECFVSASLDQTDTMAVISGEDMGTTLPILEECLTPESFAVMMGDAGAGPQSLGDDAEFDLLAERCQSDSAYACDLLYERSSIGSEYEAIAFECGGRVPASEFYCTAGMLDADGDGFVENESPGWQAAFDACTGGDMIACDFTLWMSELGSEAERVGNTCGDRRTVVTRTCLATYGELAE